MQIHDHILYKKISDIPEDGASRQKHIREFATTWQNVIDKYVAISWNKQNIFCN
jgi:hypothetical protein